MSRRQKIIVWCATGLIVLTGLFPPWANTSSSGDYSYGWRFIVYYGRGRLDIIRLLVEWVIIAAPSAVLYFTLGQGRHET